MNETQHSSPEDSRIQELLVELQESRADQRHNDSIILQAVSATATILGIVSGISFITGSNSEKLQKALFSPLYVENAEGIQKAVYSFFTHLTPARLFFYISCLAFCSAFAFITSRGIRAALQYYYVQNIEDRLRTLINGQRDDDGRGDFVHYGDYIAPITTLKMKHISSSHTAWHYITLLLVAFCAVGCSLAFVLFQYLTIQHIIWSDTFILLITFTVMVFALFMYIRITNNADKIAQFAVDTAHINVEYRLSKEKGNARKPYERAEVFRHYLLYYSFPRAKEWYKALFIIAGYVYGCVVFHHSFSSKQLCFIVLLFEVLIYSARYQINDIIGVNEDKEMNANRLVEKSESTDSEAVNRAIRNSWIVVSLKILTAFILTLLFMWNNRCSVFLCYTLILVSFFTYEIAKWKRGKEADYIHSSDYWVYLAVGTGYPIRFFSGVFAVQTQLCLTDLPLHFWIGLCAIFFLGVFASLLSWEQIISHLVQNNKMPAGNLFQHKKYINRLYKHLVSRASIDGEETLLRKRGRIRNDYMVPWNCFFILASFSCLLAANTSETIPIAILVSLFVGVLLLPASGPVLMNIVTTTECAFVLFFLMLNRLPVASSFYLLSQAGVCLVYWYLRYEPKMIILQPRINKRG